MRVAPLIRLAPAVLAAAFAVILAAAAPALTVDDVLPLYFEGVGGQGLSTAAIESLGLEARFEATVDDDWILAGAGDGLPVRIEQQLSTIYQQPANPTPENPLIADSTWRVDNLSAGNLTAPLLVFTTVDPAGTYPVSVPPTGLDGNLVDLLAYSFSGTDYVYGVLQLPDLAVGEHDEVTVRYIVAGDLAPGSPASLPALGVSILGSYTLIPEPSTGLLLGFGLSLCAAAARRRAD